MEISIDWVYLVASAFTVAGIIEYVKGFFKKAPAWTWRVVLPVACIGVAFAGDGGVYQIATNALLILALSQLCYEGIIAKVKKTIG